MSTRGVPPKLTGPPLIIRTGDVWLYPAGESLAAWACLPA
ncbi:hypothetical protein LMIY3S_01549 [Labrys miyagiensis]